VPGDHAVPAAWEARGILEGTHPAAVHVALRAAVARRQVAIVALFARRSHAVAASLLCADRRPEADAGPSHIDRARGASVAGGLVTIVTGFVQGRVNDAITAAR